MESDPQRLAEEASTFAQMPSALAWVCEKLLSYGFFQTPPLVGWLRAKSPATRREKTPQAESGTVKFVHQKMAPEASMVAAQQKEKCSFFQMPLHYPRYSKADYEKMPEWRLDLLLAEYGLPVTGDVEAKRKFAIGAFVWASH